MINLDIGRTLNNSDATTKSTKNIKSDTENTKTVEVKEKKSFSEFLGEKVTKKEVTKKEVTKNPIKEQVSTDEAKKVEVLEVATEKLESIITKIEEGLDDEAMEMLSQLLEFLNIPISQSGNLQGLSLGENLKKLIPVDLTDFKVDSLIMEKDGLTSILDKLLKGNTGKENFMAQNNVQVNMLNNNMLNANMLDTTVLNGADINKNNVNELASKILELLTISSDNTSLKLVERLETSLNKILPLLQQQDGSVVKFENIIMAIKDKINNISKNNTNKVQVVDGDIESLDLEKTNVKNTEVKNVYFKNETSVENKVINNVTNLKESIDKAETQYIPVKLDSATDSKEEKVLSKILGEDTKDFTGIFNKLQVKSTAINNVSQEGAPILKETFNADVIKNVKFMVRNAVSELNVKIYPKELGEITIKILSEEGIMRAEIKATSKETYNILNSNMNEIKKSLSNENIRIHDVNIGLYSEDTTYFSGRDSKDRSNSNNDKKITSINGVKEEDDLLVEEQLDNSNLNLLA